MTEGIRSNVPLVDLVRAALQSQFVLVDVGASGGIDPGFRQFGDRLRAFAFDPNIGECSRLQEAETLSGVRYCAAFVGLSPEHPFAVEKANAPHLTRNPWQRLAVFRTLQIRAAYNAALSEDERTKLNLWSDVKLADSDNPIYLDKFFKDHDVEEIDFFKIDIDGYDFDVLNSISSFFQEGRVLAAAIEVNFVGGASPFEHTFHNTDRFMRQSGFMLSDLSIRRYSLAALPEKYALSIPAQGIAGRPLQGDAIYTMDPLLPELADSLGKYSDDRLLKLIAIHSMIGKTDSAAELLLAFTDRLSKRIDVELALDLLAQQATGNPEITYRSHMAAFERDDAAFYS